MINLGLIDVLLLFILLAAFIYSIRRHYRLPFYIVLVLILLIELERLVPGTMTSLGNGIHVIDAVNERLPHIQIAPIISIE